MKHVNADVCRGQRVSILGLESQAVGELLNTGLRS